MTADSNPVLTRHRLTTMLWLIFGLAILVFVFRNLSWAATWSILSQLRPIHLFILLVLNIGFISCLFGSWWRVIQVLGDAVPFTKVVRYGLGGFAVSYFTPGPQFGGEPIQVMLLHRQHHISINRAAAGVTVDKTIHLVVNASVLLIGIIIATVTYSTPSTRLTSPIWWLLPLFGVPIALLSLWAQNRQPLSRLAGRFVPRWAEPAERFEAELCRFCYQRPDAVWQTVGIATLAWLFLIAEFWMMAFSLGLSLNPIELMTVVTAIRVAWLFPLPSAVGVLEAAQVLALTLIGVPNAAELGFSLVLLIRLRDILLGISGFLLIRSRLPQRGMIEEETIQNR